MSTSNRKEVLAAGTIVAQGAARSRKKLPACGRKKKFSRVHYFWAVLYICSIGDRESEHISGDRYGFLISFPYITNEPVFRQFVILVRHTSTSVWKHCFLGCLTVCIVSHVVKLPLSMSLSRWTEVIFRMEFINPP